MSAVLGFAVGIHMRGAYLEGSWRRSCNSTGSALDVKAAESDYPLVTGIEGSGASALASLDLVRGAGAAYEVRTTVHLALTTDGRAGAAGARAGRARRHPLDPAAVSPDRMRERTAGGQCATGTTLPADLLARLSADVPTIEVRG